MYKLLKYVHQDKQVKPRIQNLKFSWWLNVISLLGQVATHRKS